MILSNQLWPSCTHERSIYTIVETTCLFDKGLTVRSLLCVGTYTGLMSRIVRNGISPSMDDESFEVIVHHSDLAPVYAVWYMAII